MLIDDKYMTKTDFLPENGLLYVDTCGMNWVANHSNAKHLFLEDIQRNPEYHKFSLKRMNSFLDVFRKRGSVLTSDGILDEIEHSKRFYKKSDSVSRRIARKLKSGGKKREVGSSLGEHVIRHLREGGKVYSSAFDLLEEGMEKYGGQRRLSVKDVNAFVGLQPGIGFADRGLIISALLPGNGAGILSADIHVLNAFGEGIKYFGSKDSYVCNSAAGDVTYAADWKELNRIA